MTVLMNHLLQGMAVLINDVPAHLLQGMTVLMNHLLQGMAVLMKDVPAHLLHDKTVLMNNKASHLTLDKMAAVGELDNIVAGGNHTNFPSLQNFVTPQSSLCVPCYRRFVKFAF